jgi:hypothetical protein
MKTTKQTLEGWRPIAYVALQDTVTRTRICSVLERAGWI